MTERKNSKRQIYLPILLALALVAGMFIDRISFPGVGGEIGKRLLVYPQTNKIDKIINLIDEEYVDSINKEDFVESIIPDVLKHLDPHTVYIPAKELQAANQELEGNFGGIGVEFSMQKDTVLVVGVVRAGPPKR
jgi:carboxyl-terminal processing protease